MTHRNSNNILLIMFSIMILTVTDSNSSELRATTLQTETSISEANLNSTANSPNVQFTYNGSFTLFTEQNQVIVPSLYNSEDTTLDPHTELHLDVLHSSSSSSSLLVSIIWPTNKIGSILEQWLYSCDATGSLNLLWSLSDEQPYVESSQLNEHTLELTLPDYQHTQPFLLKNDDIKRLQSNSTVPNPLAPADLIEMGPTTAYNIIIDDSDYSDIWAVTRLLYLQSPPFSVGNLYTLFKTIDHKVIVDKVIFSSYADPTEPVIGFGF